MTVLGPTNKQVSKNIRSLSIMGFHGAYVDI